MIEVKDLSFQYDEESVLENVSFTARPGEITAIVGANGAGKSTLLKCISGFEKASGTVKICGQDAFRLSREKLAGTMSYLDQCTDCEAELNVYEVVLLGRLQRLSFRVTDDDLQKVDAILTQMSLEPFANRNISELSGGQRQLVFIAQTLIKDPQVLILDEPTSALDLRRQFEIMEFLQKITKERMLTTLVTLHHLDIAAKYADHVVVLADKRVYTEASPAAAFTEKMLHDVYEVEAEVYTDRRSERHIVALGAISL